MKFMIIQIFGVVAWFIESISYWANTKKKILFLQVIADLFFTVHYYLLSAKTGALVCFVSLIREYIFFITKTQKAENIWCCVMIFIYVILGLTTTGSIIDLLPICAEIIYCYTLICGTNEIIIGGIIDSIYWLIYGIICNSYVGIMSDIIVIISNTVALIKSHIIESKIVIKNYSNE